MALALPARRYPGFPVPTKAPSRTSSARLPVQNGGNTSAFIWILLLYAVLVTGGAGYLLYDKLEADKPPEGPGQVHPSFKSIADIYGQYERADRKKVAMVEGMPALDAEVPEELRVKLGQPITLGQLEITPTKVEHRSVLRFRQEKGKEAVATKETPNPVYILRMKLKNVSNDVYFHPNDPAFNRRRSANPGAISPYNAIIVDGTYYPGGPFEWPLSNRNLEREFIQGQQADAQLLRPKEERETVICSDFDPSQKLEPAIRKHRSDAGTSGKPILWRVQLRTGLQTEPNAKGEEKDIPITSVFAVEFMAQDVK